MPKNTKSAGVRQPEKVLNSLGKWVNNKFAGMRTSHNTRISDYQQFNLGRKKVTHTSPVAYDKFNDGHDNPTRMRHAATKVAHKLNSLGRVGEEQSFTANV